MSVFDPAINNQHTQECLKRLLFIYKATDMPSANRVEFECIYMLFNLGQTDVFMHYYDMPQAIR